ncbi:MAG TPA: hypothetical protein VFS20_16335 [Longimicrobium sp.]|nr:hypothetical protein [Longimicrobium sp.]
MTLRRAGAGVTLAAALVTTPALTQPGPRHEPVTLTIPIAPADAGSYEIRPEQGVRPISARVGTAGPGGLTLSFFVPATLLAGRQRIAAVALPRISLPVWYEVPERRRLAVTTPAQHQLRVGKNAVTAAVANLGNVPEQLVVRASSSTLRVRLPAGPLLVPAMETRPLTIEVAVPDNAAAGVVHEVTLELAPARGTVTRAALRLVVAATRASFPLELGIVRGASNASWLAADGWLSDSIRARAAFGTRAPAWLRAAPRGRFIALAAARWRIAAGEMDLPRATVLSPWLYGTGVRAELGRTAGWTGAAAWIRDVDGGRAFHLSTRTRTGSLRLGAGVLALSRDSARFLMPTAELSRLGPLQGSAAAGVLLSPHAVAPVGSATAAFRTGPLRTTVSANRSALAGDAGSVTVTSGATGTFDLRASPSASLFGSVVASRSGLDSAGSVSSFSQAAAIRAGARYRNGGVAVSPTMELRSFTSSRSGRTGVLAAGLLASGAVTRGLGVRGEATWAKVDRDVGATARPWFSGTLEWTGDDAFFAASARYGDAPGASPRARGAIRAQITGGLRTAPLSLDVDAAVDRGRAGTPAALHGTATAALHIAPRSDLLVAVERSAARSDGAAWSLSIGLRSSLVGLPLPRRDRHAILFDDRNMNARRDPGEPGIGGVALSSGEWTGVTDAAGRFSPPPTGIQSVVPDLTGRGSGWRVGAVGDGAVAAWQAGSVSARAVFAPAAGSAVERTPRGSLVLEGSSTGALAAEVDSAGMARWTGLAAGTYRVYHVAPGAALPRSPPQNSVTLQLVRGRDTTVTVPASYQPRRILVRNLDTGGELAVKAPHATAPVPAMADTGAPRAREHPCRAGTVVRPGMTEAEVSCALGVPARVARRGDWAYWFYARPPRIADVTAHDLVFFRGGKVVAAILRSSGRRYEGPPPHEALSAAAGRR